MELRESRSKKVRGPKAQADEGVAVFGGRFVKTGGERMSLCEAFYRIHRLGDLVVLRRSDAGAMTVDECWNAFKRTSPSFVRRYAAYARFRDKGWTVRCGAKFGGDFVLYERGPRLDHAAYVAAVRRPTDWFDALARVRLAGTAAKDALFVSVEFPDGDPLDSPASLNGAVVRETLARRRPPSEKEKPLG